MDRNSTHPFRKPPTVSIRRVRGFTLVELMISVTIGLVLVAGLATVFASSSGGSKTNDRLSEMAFNGRYTMNVLKRELRQAGYRGYTWAEPNTPSTSIGTISGECGDGTGLFVSNIRQGIWGANDSNPFVSNCLPASEKSGADGGDILVLRRVDETPLPLASNRLYFQSTFAAGEIFRGTTVPTSIPATAPLATFAVKTFVYYVRPYTNAANEVPKVPALFRVSLKDDGSMAPELVATGIEQLQIQYGRHTTAATTQLYDAFTLVNCATCSLDSGSGITNTPTVWDEVDSVRLWILVRSSTPEPGYTNQTSYVMADQTYSVNDGYRRELFNTVVQLRN